MILPLLLAVQSVPPPPPEPEGESIVVRAPLAGTPQTPATMVVEPAAMLIATFDADGDAVVSYAELDAGIAATMGAEAKPMRYVAFGDWALRWLGSRGALPSPFEVDRNGDNQVTLAELQDQFSRLFARYDTDHDRLVTRAELLTYRTAPIGADGPERSPAPDARRRPPRRR